jgi:hypothetical protein
MLCAGVRSALALGAMATWCYPMDGAAKAITPPGYDRVKIDQHRQLPYPSCIPSSVEMVLKLIDRVPRDFFEIQEAWKNKLDGSFADFDNRTIAGVTFRQQFSMRRGFRFPIKKLFAAIDAELEQGRYVIVGLRNDPGSYHNWVIVGRTDSGEYRAVTKSGGDTLEIVDTKARIRRMKGTDIGTYTIAP